MDWETVSCYAVQNKIVLISVNPSPRKDMSHNFILVTVNGPRPEFCETILCWDEMTHFVI
jgi:hypothetical protein